MFVKIFSSSSDIFGGLDQDDHTAVLGEGSNAIVWPKGPSEDDEEMDEVERYDNQRLMRIGKPSPI